MAAPGSVDLSGNWLRRTTKGGPGSRDDRGLQEPPIVVSGSSRRQRVSRRTASSGSSAHVFLEYGDALKITQTDFGLFISYDRSVVEEYRFGENRLISIGPIEAMRASGWEGSSFVVETLDKSGAVLFESWQLKDDGAVLVREIRISRDEKVSLRQQQIFDRG